MEEILKELNNAGVHSIKNDYEIILEMSEEKVSHLKEVDQAVRELINNLKSSKQKKILFECPKASLDQLPLAKEKMKIAGERVIYTRGFTEPISSVPDYEVWSVHNPDSIAFLSEVMGRSFNETQRFLASMETELPAQVRNMYTVLVTSEPVGVVFPHLEPNTAKQGRIFWIGMHPKYLRKGLGQSLHLLGLYRLINDFKANSYLGATKADNTPMRKIMIANGCTQNKNTFISLEYIDRGRRDSGTP